MFDNVVRALLQIVSASLVEYIYLYLSPFLLSETLTMKNANRKKHLREKNLTSG